MQKDLHPKYYNQVRVSCACGASMITGSTLPGPIRVEICSNCHPFFTGEKKLVDTEGRVDRFERLQQQARQIQTKQKKKTRSEEVDGGQQDKQKPMTLKELLEQAR